MTADSRRVVVERFFEGTGSTYDDVVRWFTGGIDKRWKREMVAWLPGTPKRIVDLAAGTGILTFDLARAFPQTQVIGVELRAEYLDIARDQARRHGLSNVEFILGRAEDVQLPGSADAITGSYLPKYADLPRLAATMFRTLRPGGVIVLHDFTYPTPAVLAWAWEIYMPLMWLVGGLFYPQWRRTFRELPLLIRQSNWVQELQFALRTAGFTQIGQQRLTLGGAALVTARKECPSAKETDSILVE